MRPAHGGLGEAPARPALLSSARHGTRPTYVRTALTEPLQKNEDFIIGTMGRSPTPRFGEAWELIGPAVFLASDAARFVTGSTVRVDGGYLSSGI